MNSRIGSPFYLFFLNPDHVASRSLLLLSAAMSSALTREYAERTAESKVSLHVKKLNNRKRDSEATKALSVRVFTSVFGFGENLLRLCSFAVFGNF